MTGLVQNTFKKNVTDEMYAQIDDKKVLTVNTKQTRAVSENYAQQQHSTACFVSVHLFHFNYKNFFGLDLAIKVTYHVSLLLQFFSPLTLSHSVHPNIHFTSTYVLPL